MDDERTVQGVNAGDWDDAALWAASLDGDSRAFATLFARHRDRVFRSAARLTGSTADADDVAAAAFLELWRRRDRVRLVEGSVIPWLLVTVSNLARNHRRTRRRYRAVLDRLPTRDPDDGSGEILSRLDHRAGHSELSRALRSVSALDATLLVLTAVEGCTVAEAAAALGLSTSAANSRLSRSRTRLRSRLTLSRELTTIREESP